MRESICSIAKDNTKRITVKEYNYYGEVPIRFQSGSNEIPMETGGIQGANNGEEKGILRR